MHLGIDSFVSAVTDPSTGRVVGPEERMEHLLEEIALADRVGLVLLRHRRAPPPRVLRLRAAGDPGRRGRPDVAHPARQRGAVLSAADPVRVFQQFATLDLISKGRIDLVVGRGSFTEAFPLFGLDLADYDALFEEKLDLLLRIRDVGEGHLVRAAPAAADRPGRLPAPAAGPAADLGRRRRHPGVLRPRRAARAAADGRDHRRRAAPVRARSSTSTAGPARRPATPPETLQVGLHVFGFVAESTQAAADTIYPGWHEMFSQGLPRARLRRRRRRRSSTRPAARTAPSSWAIPTTVAAKIRRVSRAARRRRPPLAADDQPAARARRPAARHRAARHRGRPPGQHHLGSADGTMIGMDAARYWDEQAQTFNDEPDHGLTVPSVRAAWARLLLPLMPPCASVADMERDRHPGRAARSGPAPRVGDRPLPAHGRLVLRSDEGGGRRCPSGVRGRRRSRAAMGAAQLRRGRDQACPLGPSRGSERGARAAGRIAAPWWPAAPHRRALVERRRD